MSQPLEPRSPKLALVASQRETVSIEIPRSALTIIERPRSVSQKTSRAVLGIDHRPFLDVLPEYRSSGGIVMSLGKLRIVEIDPFVAWLTRREQARAGVLVENDVDDTEAEIAKRWGVVEVAK